MTTAGVYDRANRRFLEIGELVDALGHRVEPRPLTEKEQAFLASHGTLRGRAKGSA